RPFRARDTSAKDVPSAARDRPERDPGANRIAPRGPNPAQRTASGARGGLGPGGADARVARGSGGAGWPAGSRDLSEGAKGFGVHRRRVGGGHRILSTVESADDLEYAA